MSDEIAWLRQQVAKSTPEDRKAAYKMADMGDLNEGYIAALLEAACALLAERDEVGERVATLEDGIRKAVSMACVRDLVTADFLTSLLGEDPA